MRSAGMKENTLTNIVRVVLTETNVAVMMMRRKINVSDSIYKGQ